MKKIFLAFVLLVALDTRAQFCFTLHAQYSNSGGANNMFGLCKGDFDNDGILDLAVTNTNTSNITVYKGLGSGNFGVSGVYSCGNMAHQIIAVDFNNDGFLDLATANFGGSNFSVLMNSGAGTFPSSTNFFSGNSPKSITSADFNNDGNKDIAVVNSASNSYSAFLGNGVGTFTLSQNTMISNGPYGICSADFDKDGNQDLVTVSNGTGQALYMRGNGNGTFVAPATIPAFSLNQPYEVTAADLNGDGNMDLAAASDGNQSVEIVFGLGTGIFNSGPNLPTGNGPRMVAVGDLTDDAIVDLACPNFNSGDISLFKGLGGGSFGGNFQMGTGNGARGAAIGDFNADGLNDIALTYNGNNLLYIYLNTQPNVSVTGNLSYCNPGSTTLTASGATSYTWSNSATTNTVSLNPSTTTNYYVIGGDITCSVKDTAFVTVTVNPTPFVQTLPGGPGTICEGQSTSIRDLGDGTSQTWMPGSLTGTMVTVSPTVTTTYTVTSSFTTGCSATGTIQVFVNASPTVTINTTATVVCSGSPVTLTASGANTYTWTGGISNGVAFTPTATATYTVTGTGGNSCTKSISQLVNVNSLPTVNANANPPLVCLGAPVTLTGSGSATTYTWSGGATDGLALPASSQIYTVTGTDANNCVNTATISVTAPAPLAPAICMVTVDSLSINNVIIWDKTLYQNADTFVVYRDTANGNYAPIAKLPYAMLSQYTDTARSIGAVNGDPNITTYRYKLGFIDTCGVLSPKSLYHNSIYQYNISSLFLWNQYEIEGQPVPVPGLSNYVLKRDNLGQTGNYVTAATAGASSTSINDPQYATYQLAADWRVETIWNITCTPTAREANGIQGTIVKSKSNIKNNRTTNVQLILDRLVSVYPNPTSGDLFLHFNSNVSGSLTLKVYSALGTEVYSKLLVNPSGDLNIDMGSFENGVYLIQLGCDAGIITKKVIKN